MKIFNDYINESSESIGNSMEYILQLLEEKEMSSRLSRFERDAIGDITSIAFDVNDLTPKKREDIIASLHRNGFRTAAIEFHDWNKIWTISIDKIRIQRKSTANILIQIIYFGISNTNVVQPQAEQKSSMLDRLMGRSNNLQ